MTDATIKNAKIASVSLGFEDHGILTAWVHLDYGGQMQGFGGYGYSYRPEKKDICDKRLAEFVLGVLRTLEVDLWEKLPGTVCRVESDRMKVYRIGHALRDKWFDPTK